MVIHAARASSIDTSMCDPLPVFRQRARNEDEHRLTVLALLVTELVVVMIR